MSTNTKYDTDAPISESCSLRTLDHLLRQVALVLRSEHIYLLRSTFSSDLFYLFVTHCILLDGFVDLGVRGCSSYEHSLHPELHAFLMTSFLPAVFRAITTVATVSSHILDVDGRVFSKLLHFTLELRRSTLESLFGPKVVVRVNDIVSAAGIETPDLRELARRWPSPPVTSTSRMPRSSPTLRLLPFTNGIFVTELRSVHVPTTERDLVPAGHFAPGIIYQDTHHWHNQKTLLPHHQGGEKPAPLTAWERMKILKRAQREMTRFQRFAETLRGTMGVSFLQQVIASAETTKGNGKKVRVNRLSHVQPDHSN